VNSVGAMPGIHPNEYSASGLFINHEDRPPQFAELPRVPVDGGPDGSTRRSAMGLRHVQAYARPACTCRARNRTSRPYGARRTHARAGAVDSLLSYEAYHTACAAASVCSLQSAVNHSTGACSRAWTLYTRRRPPYQTKGYI
jgi:hypothetical protein